MMYRYKLSVLLVFSVFSLFFSCASPRAASPGTAVPDEAGREEDPGGEIYEAEGSFGEKEPEEALSQAFVFTPGELPFAESAPGVGLVTRERNDPAASLGEGERAALTESFRTAYIDSLLRGLPLAGVLGGDLVHGWPAGDPSGWVQNWRASSGAANSWGLPRLVLAIRGTREEAARRVFIVRGKVLDLYGKSAGINGANGAMGYGSPRGHEFFYEGKIAQRFDFGLITVDREGKGAFIPETPPSLSAEAPGETGVFSGDVPPGAAGTVRAAFLAARQMALDRGAGTMIPDRSGQYISFTGIPADFPGGEALKGLYIQSFNRESVSLILPDSPRLPPYPRFVGPPCLDVLLAAPRPSVSGGETLEPLEIKFSGGDEFSRRLMGGFALYGIPLSDPVPFEDENAQWFEIQRFSRGSFALRYSEAEEAAPNEKM